MRPIQASGDERRAIMHQRASAVTVSGLGIGLIAVSPRRFIADSLAVPAAILDPVSLLGKQLRDSAGL